MCNAVGITRAGILGKQINTIQRTRLGSRTVAGSEAHFSLSTLPHGATCPLPAAGWVSWLQCGWRRESSHRGSPHSRGEVYLCLSKEVTFPWGLQELKWCSC